MLLIGAPDAGSTPRTALSSCSEVVSRMSGGHENAGSIPVSSTKISGCSEVVSRSVRDRENAGSIPVTPTLPVRGTTQALRRQGLSLRLAPICRCRPMVGRCVANAEIGVRVPAPARYGVHSVAALHACLWNKKFGFDPRWTPQDLFADKADW